MTTEETYHVSPVNDGRWRVKHDDREESIHTRKAVAALFAKLAAVNGKRDGIVIFYRQDGSVEVEHRYNARLKMDNNNRI